MLGDRPGCSQQDPCVRIRNGSLDKWATLWKGFLGNGWQDAKQEWLRSIHHNPNASGNEFNKWKDACMVRKDKRKEGVCWLLAATWKIEKEWAGSLEEENRRLKRELSAKDTDVLAVAEQCLDEVEDFSASHATLHQGGWRCR